MAGDTVLVVESNATARSLLRVTLETYGYGVTDVADGAMALEAANRSTPDIVLLDLLLPDVEGAELARRLRARPGMADKPIVALIGFLAPATEDIEFDAVLEKPIDPTRLLSTVRWALRSLTAVRQNGEKDSPQSQGEPRFDEEARRAVPEVERQTKGKLELARKCALLETELTVLSRVADALATGRSPTDALKDVFLSSLDMAGIAKGALFRARDHLLELEHTTVLPAGEKDAVAQLFAEGTSIRLAIEQCRVLALPSPAMAEDDARDILLRCGVKSALIVPIVRGGTSYGAIFFGGRGLELTEPEPLAFGRALADQVARAFALIDRFERVSTEEKNLRGLVNSMQDLVVTFDREHRATGIHGRWSEDGSIHPREALGKRIEETVGFSDDPVHAEAMDRALSGESLIYEWIAGTDRGTLYMQTSVSPLRGPRGEVIGVVGVGRDVTQMKALQEKLILADRMASVGLLAASVTHEINNPLAVAVANLQLARESFARNPGPAQALGREIIDAGDAVGRVAAILRDLRVFCRPDNDQPTNVELVAVIEASLRIAVNEIRPRARVQRSYRPAPLVFANEGRLGQVFLILIANAAQAMDEGNAGYNELGISTREGPGRRAIVEISDTGPGIPPEVIPKLFCPFLTKSRGSGSSLGLTVCHRIVNDLGGSIEVESEQGKGTLFRVILPGVAMAPRTFPPPAMAGRASRRGSVLVIDDDQLVGETLVRVLSPSHEVVALNSARLALARIVSGENFDVILCDVMMPDMTGADFYRELDRLAPEQLSKIIFMSGGAFTSATQTFLEHTVNMWVQKPFDIRALLTLINGKIG